MRRVLALALGGGGILLTLAAATLLILGQGSGLPSLMTGSTEGRLVDVLFALLFASWSFVGAILALRMPHDRMGWLFLAVGFVGPLIELPGAYGDVVFKTDPTSAQLVLITWLGAWTWIPALVLIGVVIATAPYGHLPSPRWRPFFLVAGVLTLFQVALAFAPGELPPLGVENPMGIESPAIWALVILGTLGMGALMFGAAVALVVRFRRARGVERQRLKWVASAGALIGLAAPLASVSYGGDPLVTGVSSAVAALAVALFPVATAIAILRHRLYDIDLVIRRTFVYGPLSAAIAATYIALVVLFQAALRPLTGGSEIAVAVSTLATLALVQPLRRRIQDVVDRRFYRSRYDAARTLDAFASRLRDEVDLDALRAGLLDVIGDTVRPAHGGVWLRGRAR